MTQDTMKCPTCGSSASGKFCNNCGSPLTGADCRSCGTELSVGARFCHLCGAPQGNRRSAAAEGVMLTRIGWIVAGVALVALFIVLAIRLPGAGSAAPPPQPLAAPPFATRPAPDISNMTPRERADSLFNRIMREYESGNQSQVEFFRPMALQAYALLGTLDADARYHVGLIYTISGEMAAASAQVDTILGQTPDHLMGYMLQAAVARLQNDQAALLDAYSGFLSAYSSEIQTDRREYTEHGRAIETFRAEARQATGQGA